MELEVDCGHLDEYFSQEAVVFLNRAITDPESLRRDIDGEVFLEGVEDLVESIEASDRSELEISRDEDHFALINRGVLGSLAENQLFYECRENNDAVHLMAKIMQVIASNQVFGDGNKRTAYLSGCLFIIDYQVSGLALQRPVIPVLNDELVELLSDISVGEKDEDDLENYFSDLREDILEKV